MALMPGFGHSDAVEFISQPLNSVLMLILSVVLAYHSYLGVQVVVEDYVHGHLLKVVSLILSRFAHVFLAVAAVYAILKLGIGA